MDRSGCASAFTPALGALAEYAILDGRPDDGLGPLRQSTRINHANGEGIELTINLRRYARVLVERGDAAAGLQLLGAADAVDEQMGAGRVTWATDLDPGTLDVARRSLADDEVDALRERGRSMSLDDAVATILGD